MLKFGGREFVALLLTLLVAAPPRISVAANGPAARAALGSIESRGSVRIGEVLTPSQNTLFAGDRVQTNNGGAVIQYRQGSRVVLSSETVANFAPARVQLEKGLMTFESASNSGMIFAASTLRLEPGSAKTAANVTFTDSKASVAVSEGTLKVVDSSGLQLASLNAGEARLFEESPASPEPASASSPSPSAPAAAPQGGGGESHKWMLALGVGVVGVALGTVGIVRANDANSRADSAGKSAATANAAAATAQTAADQANAAARAAAAQVTALQAQLSAASAQLTTLQAQNTASAAQIAQLQTQLAALTTQATALAAQLSTLQGQNTASAAQIAQLQTQLAALTTQTNALTAQVTALQLQLRQVCNAISPIAAVPPGCH
jgi:cell division protein FtsB